MMSEFESSPSKQQANIGDCFKVEGKSEEHSYDPDCACEECMMKRESKVQVIYNDRPVKRQKTGGHLQKVIVIREDANVITNVQHPQVDISAGQAEAQNDQNLSDIDYELEMLRTVFIKSIGNGGQFTFCDYPQCGKLLEPDEQQQLAHLKLHTKPFICDFVDCLRRFTSHTTCTVHKRVHACAFQCDLPGCVKRFKHIDMLKLHKRDHTDPNVIICGFGDCEKVFYSKARYPAHYFTHSDDGIDKQQFGCDWAQCGRMLTTQFNLSIHRQLHTAELNPSPSHLK